MIYLKLNLSIGVNIQYISNLCVYSIVYIPRPCEFPGIHMGLSIQQMDTILVASDRFQGDCHQPWSHLNECQQWAIHLVKRWSSISWFMTSITILYDTYHYSKWGKRTTYNWRGPHCLSKQSFGKLWATQSLRDATRSAKSISPSLPDQVDWCERHAPTVLKQLKPQKANRTWRAAGPGNRVNQRKRDLTADTAN